MKAANLCPPQTLSAAAPVSRPAASVYRPYGLNRPELLLPVALLTVMFTGILGLQMGWSILAVMGSMAVAFVLAILAALRLR